MPRKGENIYKRKDGRWEGRYIKRYNTNGKAVYGYVYEHSYTKVKRKLRDAISSNLDESKSSASISFNALFDSWLDNKKEAVKESTYVQYERIVEKHLRLHWGMLNVTDFLDQLVEQYIDQLQAKGRLDGNGGLSSKSINDIAVVLKSVIRYAQRHGINIPSSLQWPAKMKTKKKQFKVLLLEDQRKLVGYLTDNIDLEKVAILLSLFCGLRIGEICALKWEDINLEYSVLSVRNTLQRIKCNDPLSSHKTKVIITSPKSDCSIRDIPIPDFLVECLKKFAASPSSFVLTGDEHRYVEPRTMQYRFKRILLTCELEPLNFHALRHTFATRCVELEFEIKSLSEVLGHSTVSITLNRYVHPSFETKKQNMQKLAVLSN